MSPSRCGSRWPVVIGSLRSSGSADRADRTGSAEPAGRSCDRARRCSLVAELARWLAVAEFSCGLASGLVDRDGDDGGAVGAQSRSRCRPSRRCRSACRSPRCRPRARAASSMRLITSLRLSVRFLVMPWSSPPNIDLKPAPIWEKALRERTVRPNTSPHTRWISQPGMSFVVTTSMFALSRVPQRTSDVAWSI